MRRRSTAPRRPPTEAEGRLLRQIAQANGRLVLTHRTDGDWYQDGNGNHIPTRAARSIIPFLIPERDGLFDFAPQSWRVRLPKDPQ